MTAPATTQKCRACIDTGTLGPEGECTDPAHQVAPDVHPRTANEPDLPPLPPKWSDPGYLAREAERRRAAVPPEALSAALAAWDARITGPIVSDTEGTEDALQEVVEAAFRAVPDRVPEPSADLRDAIARALWASSDLDREENPDRFDTDSDRGFWHRQADAVLLVVHAHVAAEVERARAEGAAEVAKWRGRFCDAGLHLRTHRRDGRCWACDQDARRAACPHEGEPVPGMAVLGPVWDCRTCGKRLGEYDGLTYSEMCGRIAAGGAQRD